MWCYLMKFFLYCWKGSMYYIVFVNDGNFTLDQNSLNIGVRIFYLRRTMEGKTWKPVSFTEGQSQL